MSSINCSLLTDGPSDIALLPILKWLMEEHLKSVIVRMEWADLTKLPQPPGSLVDKICSVIEIYPCNILFVHRDAESQPPDMRYEEIRQAVVLASQRGVFFQHICVVPVRMQEAWLLLDEWAIRRSAGNPNGPMGLDLPSAARIESIPDPKDLLYRILKTASGLHGRRLKKLRPDILARDVSNHMRDFSCLRVLPAFQRLESDIQKIVRDIGHNLR